MKVGPRRVAIFQDSPDFGGHERAFLTWLPALLDSDDIDSLHFCVPADNHALLKALEQAAHPRLFVFPMRFTKARAEPFRAPLRFAYGRFASDFVTRAQCDVVLMLQGRIENLATPMIWLPRGVDVVSYLPMAHSGLEMGHPAALAWVTDWVKRAYYARPQRIIVPSQAAAAQVNRAGAKGTVYVVPNVALQPATHHSAGTLREDLGLPAGVRIALFMGRFDTHQKGLDRLIRHLRKEVADAGDWFFLFVGQGHGAADIQMLLSDTQIRGKVVSWTADPAAYLAASDILLLPSRFEGVPLVMLEALQAGLPILASNIDIFEEFLPPSARHDFDRTGGVITKLERLTTADAVQAYRRHAERMTIKMNTTTSQRAFLLGLLGREDATLNDRPAVGRSPPGRSQVTKS